MYRGGSYRKRDVCKEEEERQESYEKENAMKENSEIYCVSNLVKELDAVINGVKVTAPIIDGSCIGAFLCYSDREEALAEAKATGSRVMVLRSMNRGEVN